MADKIYTHAGLLFEFVGEYGVCTLLQNLADQSYYCATKTNISDMQINWQLACVFDSKTQAVKFAKEVNTMYEQMKNRALVESVGRTLDEQISNHNKEYVYDFDTAFDNTLREYSTFDICTAVALTVSRASEWDRRYSNTSIKWANEFLYNNEIDVEDYESTRLCNTHPAVMNGFAEWLSDKTNGMTKQDLLSSISDNELDLTVQERTR